jgi:hypothetical protein
MMRAQRQAALGFCLGTVICLYEICITMGSLPLSAGPNSHCKTGVIVEPTS